jgi:hypothetical protein
LKQISTLAGLFVVIDRIKDELSEKPRRLLSSLLLVIGEGVTHYRLFFSMLAIFHKAPVDFRMLLTPLALITKGDDTIHELATSLLQVEFLTFSLYPSVQMILVMEFSSSDPSLTLKHIENFLQIPDLSPVIDPFVAQMVRFSIGFTNRWKMKTLPKLTSKGQQ